MQVELYCIPCKHYRSITGSGLDYICNYLLDTGEARGCPFGSGCKKRELYKKEDNKNVEYSD